VDQHGQVIDVYLSRRRDIASARRFFANALSVLGEPVGGRDRLATGARTWWKHPRCCASQWRSMSSWPTC